MGFSQLSEDQHNISALQTMFKGCLSLLETKLYCLTPGYILLLQLKLFFLHMIVSPMWFIFPYPSKLLFFFSCSQALTSSELWQMVKQHYGHDLGLSHEEMENLQLSAESSMQTRWAQSRHAGLSGHLTQCAVVWCHLLWLSTARQWGLEVMTVIMGSLSRTPPFASLDWSMDPWILQHLMRKTCLSLLVHRAPPTRY